MVRPGSPPRSPFMRCSKLVLPDSALPSSDTFTRCDASAMPCLSCRRKRSMAGVPASTTTCGGVASVGFLRTSSSSRTGRSPRQRGSAASLLPCRFSSLRRTRCAIESGSRVMLFSACRQQTVRLSSTAADVVVGGIFTSFEPLVARQQQGEGVR